MLVVGSKLGGFFFEREHPGVFLSTKPRGFSEGGRERAVVTKYSTTLRQRLLTND